MSKKIIAIVPARGLSKRVPRKNIRLLMGKSLIAYTTEAAKKVNEIKRIIISTEDEEIARVAEELECEVIQRPMNLAQDDTPTIDVIIHVLKVLSEQEGYIPDIIILLQPTSPLRTAEDISQAIVEYQQSECESLISVCEFPHPPQWALVLEKGYLKPFFGSDIFEKRGQDLTKMYLPNGAIFISSPRILKEQRTFNCNQTIPYFMNNERSIDIDTELDFTLIECLLERKNVLKGR